MLASEACPICGTRIAGEPTPTFAFAGDHGRAPRNPVPRWGFECTDCEHYWIAEPVSDSLEFVVPGLEISVKDSRRASVDRPYQHIEEFHPARNRALPALRWLLGPLASA